MERGKWKARLSACRLEGGFEGELKETRAAILEFLESRFGEGPTEVAASLEGVQELERLR